jgi:peptidyl-prolyl cis-trans isomerase SurA
MKKFFSIIFLLLILYPAKAIETKIIHNIGNEIITNIDIKNEFKYLLALNNNLKKLDKESIFKISNESKISDVVKRIELSKYFKKIVLDNDYSNILIKNTYLRLGHKSVEEFGAYLENYNLTLKDFEERLTVGALWNELIIRKYESRIVIDEEKLKKGIANNPDNNNKEYKLAEIVFEIRNKKEITSRYKEIIDNITEKGFENTASIYSFSETSKIGGDIGWVNESSLNDKIKERIKHLKVGEISGPIIVSNGILILKLKNTRVSEKKIDYKLELQKAINFEKNRQLNLYSKIYYNKIKKNLGFNE